MRKTLAALALVLLANASGYAQIKGSQPAASGKSARCELSDGTTMLAGHSGSTIGSKSDALGAQIDFATSANVVSVHGLLIPFGIYKASTLHESNNWTLAMTQVADDGITPVKSRPAEPIRLPMSITKTLATSKSLVVSFDHVGETCTLHVNWENTQASVEFAGRTKDLSTR